MKPIKPSFIQKMQLELNNYHVEKIKKQQQQYANQQTFKKENQAKLALIEFQENQTTRSLLNDLDQVYAWNVSKSESADKNKETDKLKDKQKIPQKQRITLITLANPEKRYPFRSVNNKTLGMDSLSQRNNVIPQLKFLLEKLSSPVKKKKEYGNFFSQRAASNSINNSQTKLKVNPCSQRQKQIMMKKENLRKLQEDKLSVNDIKQFKTPKRDKNQNKCYKDQFLIFSEGRKTHKQGFKNQEIRVMTSSNNRMNFINSKNQKYGVFAFSSLDTENIPALLPKKKNQGMGSNNSQNQNSLVNQRNSNNNLFANFEYGKIKRKYPSTYQIDVAYEKDLLHQLIKGNMKPNFKPSSQGKPETAYRKKNCSEKFTLANLLQ